VSLRARLVAAFVYVLVLAILALGVPLALSLADRVDAEIRSRATSQADLLAAGSAGLLGATERGQLKQLVDRAAAASRGRVIVVDARGRLIVDSVQPTPAPANYSGRPEIAAALAGHGTRRTRNSVSLHQELLATAVPVLRRGRVEGAVRVTQSVAAAHRAVRRQVLGIAVVAMLVLLFGLVLAAVLAAQFARPVRRLEAVARAVAAGDLDARATVAGSSEQRSLARSFNSMTDRLQALLAAQANFVADASHQLRTPLAGLSLCVEEAEAITSDAEVRAHLRMGLDEAGRLARTIDELLTLSRAGEVDDPGEPVDLAATAESAVARWTRYATEGKHELACAAGVPGGATGLSSVWCQRADLDRAVDALVENALAYSPPATRVEVRVTPGTLEVWDRGPGVAPDEVEHFFERFHRGTAGRTGPVGSGLGLGIARALMERWDGTVTLHARPDGAAGAVGRISLPLATDFAKALPSSG